MIRHLQHSDLDKAWWDQRILVGHDPSWYACSHVLDAASPGWEALVDERTECVMPLTTRRKYGFHYLHQPFGIQRLGVFGPEPSPDLCTAFLASIPARYKLWDIRLNMIDLKDLPTGVRVRLLTNMVIDLQRDIAEVRGRYGESHRRGLRKWRVEDAVQPMEASSFIQFILGSEQVHEWGMDKQDELVFTRLIHVASERGEGRAIGVRYEGEWSAAGFFVEHCGRTIFLKGLATPKGRKVFAMHRLIDAMIERSMDGNDVFDLAGGERAALRRFYGGFGARGELYLQARVNRLPQPFRWVKERSDGA